MSSPDYTLKKVPFKAYIHPRDHVSAIVIPVSTAGREGANLGDVMNKKLSGLDGKDAKVYAPTGGKVSYHISVRRS